MDPQADYHDIATETGLPMPDVRIGVLDLVGAGLLERHESFDGNSLWPKADLFATFDADFMDWNPATDARDLAVRLINLEEERADASEAAVSLGREPRRFNAAAAYLIAARVVEPVEYMGDHTYWPPAFDIGDELLRFVRSL